MRETININFENGFYKCSLNIRNDERLSSCSVLNKINGDVTNFIEVSPLIKPQLTNAERVILENLADEYKWIARDDEYNFLSFHKTKPEFWSHRWNSEEREVSDLFIHLFQFIKWSDKEPYNIKELLGVKNEQT